MGPKTFVACYICFKEFGSKSIPFHESKCLERWRSSNKKQPPEKRMPTPVKSTHCESSTWICTSCQKSVPASKRSEHTAECSKTLKPEQSLNMPKQNNTNESDANSKTEFSSKKGKENKNVSKNGMVQNARKKTLKKESSKGDPCEVIKDVAEKMSKDDCGDQAKIEKIVGADSSRKDDENDASMDESSTSKRSVRPQTKILRRPTPNLRHPVIQVDSDDSGDGSDKSKDNNPKRFKTGNETGSSEHKTKNFVMYNKYNVDKNIKNGSSKDRTAAVANNAQTISIPNPCNSCSRSVAPERLHSHGRVEAKSMLFRRSPQSDIKMTSPQKKVAGVEKNKKEVSKPEVKVSELKEDDVEDKGSEKEIVNSCDKVEVQNEPVRECYICQSSFRISLLLLHESQCLQNWKKENNSLSPNLRKLPPRKPEILDDDKNSNDGSRSSSSDPAWTVVQSQLVPCSLCGRTFFPERLPVHQRVCKGKTSPQPLKRASSLREQSASRREGDKEKSTPLYVPCRICGRNYGSWVIPMHETQCLRKWRKSNEKLTEMTSQEEDSFAILESIAAFDNDFACSVELRDNAWESHLQQLVPCPRCNRTFFPDRLEVHERSCKGQPTNHRRPKSNNGA